MTPMDWALIGALAASAIIGLSLSVIAFLLDRARQRTEERGERKLAKRQVWFQAGVQCGALYGIAIAALVVVVIGLRAALA